MEQHRAQGRKIALVGVAAKALTFIHASGIEPDYFFDEAALKIGKYVPGAASPIQSFEAISELTEETVFIIGAWNFASEITRKIALHHRGTPRVMVYFPTVVESAISS